MAQSPTPMILIKLPPGRTSTKAAAGLVLIPVQHKTEGTRTPNHYMNASAEKLILLLISFAEQVLPTAGINR